ncbi:hypothetical protein ACMYSQ_012663 [Aspergillus niger]
MIEFKGRSESIFIVTVVFLGISFIAVCLRCFVRLRLVRAFGWDDALMVFAMGLEILFALCGITGSLYGMGQKLEQLEDGYLETALFWWWLGQTSYVVTVVVARISIALALLRLTVSKVHTILLWCVVGVSIIVGLVFWFMLTFECKPVAHFWQRTKPGHCMSIDKLLDIAYVYSVTAMICDFTLGLLPIFLVWKLQMSRQTKAALAGILSLGCIASAGVIVRIPFLPTYKDTEFLCKSDSQPLLPESVSLMGAKTQRLRYLYGLMSKRASELQPAASSPFALSSAGWAELATLPHAARKIPEVCRCRV